MTYKESKIYTWGADLMPQKPKYPCGFYELNGKHCVINGHCVVCKVEVNLLITDWQDKSKQAKTILKEVHSE